MADCYVQTGYWDEGYTDQDICEIGPAVAERQPGGWLPIIYLDRQNRPIGLDEAKEAAIEAAPDVPEVVAAFEAVEAAQDNGISAAALDAMAAQFRVLAGLLDGLDALLAEEMRARAYEALRRAEDERDIELLLMAL
jgi:hypothetical protein